MRDEVTVDCAAKERKQWFNVKSQQTGPLLWSKPSAPLCGNMSPLLLRHARFTEILTERRDG
ncbi:hypothetical protein GBF38_020287 [Nibea albiflora]|uniref:Uncharacterized protein n=1 Tax=Nibea albiflora TaxID=240163 RepID=A0ACB7FE59_NIBAL|nr:hypothetical protein GBF38_020287 [Nibea albiflora]